MESIDHRNAVPVNRHDNGIGAVFEVRSQNTIRILQHGKLFFGKAER